MEKSEKRLFFEFDSIRNRLSYCRTFKQLKQKTEILGKTYLPVALPPGPPGTPGVPGTPGNTPIFFPTTRKSDKQVKTTNKL